MSVSRTVSIRRRIAKRLKPCACLVAQAWRDAAGHSASSCTPMESMRGSLPTESQAFLSSPTSSPFLAMSKKSLSTPSRPSTPSSIDTSSSMTDDTSESEGIIHVATSVPGFFLPSDLVFDLSAALFGPGRLSPGMRWYDSLVHHYAKGDVRTARNWIDHVRSLALFLQEFGGADKPVGAFLEQARLLPSWPTTDVEKDHVWDIFRSATAFVVDRTDSTFRGSVTSLFAEVTEQANFSFTLSDLLDVGITIEPTLAVTDHLRLDGTTLKVFRVDGQTAGLLGSYRSNKIANALGFSSLGEEVLASSWHLIGAGALGRSQTEAEARGIIKAPCDGQLQMMFYMTRDTVPKLLASRVLAVQDLIAARKTWWYILARNIRREVELRPRMFFGCALAFFFCFCMLVQTIAAVWLLSLASRTARNAACRCG